jgi:hypothetical protein
MSVGMEYEEIKLLRQKWIDDAAKVLVVEIAYGDLIFSTTADARCDVIAYGDGDRGFRVRYWITNVSTEGIYEVGADDFACLLATARLKEIQRIEKLAVSHRPIL